MSKSGSFPKKFALEGFINFAKTDKLKEHEKSIYYKNSAKAYYSFYTAMKNPTADLSVIAKNQEKNIINQNRMSIKPIVQLIIMTMRQNIPFRGNKDSEIDDENFEQGNFR